MTEKKIKQSINPLNVEYDIEQHAIIAHYEQLVVYGDETGKVTRKQKIPGKKLIHLGEFSRDEINELADQIMNSCNLISVANRPQLIRALEVLSQGFKEDGDVSLDKLNKYIDAMYDDIGSKIQATGAILTLCQQRQNLAYIAHNQVLLAALARVLREDGLQSIELGTNIAHVFYIISHFQDYGLLLLDHKAPESLFKMVLQENTRYDAFYARLSEMRKEVSNSNPKISVESYQAEYDKFKRLIASQDKMLFVALHTVINLTEVTEIRQNKEELFLPMDKLCSLLTSVLARKPPNTQLVCTVINYLKRISVIPGGIQCAVAAGVLNPLVKLLQPSTKDKDSDEIYGPVSQLLYNLAFDDNVRREMATTGVYNKIDTILQTINGKILADYQDEFNENDTIPHQLSAVIKNHDKREPSEYAVEANTKVAQLCKLVTLLADDEHGMHEFANTKIGNNLTAFLCLQKDHDPAIVQTLHQLTLDPKISSKIAKNGLMECLTDQFRRTKDKTYMQLFTGIAGAIPQDERIGRQNAAKNADQGKGKKDGRSDKQPPTAPGKHEEKKAMVAAQIYENAARLAEIALESGDPGLEKQALQVIAQAPGKYVDKEQAAKVTALAIQQLDKVGSKGKGTDIGAQIDAIGVISSMMSRASHVQQMCDKGELKRLPDQLLTVFKQSMGKTSMRLGDQGIDMQTCQYDLAIVCLVCILKACSYKVIRKDFLQRPEFLPLIVRMLYNIERDPDDPVGQRHYDVKEIKETENLSENASEQQGHSRTRRHKSREHDQDNSSTQRPKTMKPLLIQSHLQTIDKRVAHVLEALADLVCDVLMFSEPTAVENIKLLKFQRYNYDFYQKMLK